MGRGAERILKRSGPSFQNMGLHGGWRCLFPNSAKRLVGGFGVWGVPNLRPPRRGGDNFGFANIVE
jgi:hypothetical protein